MSSSRQTLLLLIAVCGTSSGCGVFDSYRLKWWTFDYNSERQLAFQASAYDHLPPDYVRMRLYHWAYNVGPSPLPAGELIVPLDAPADPDLPMSVPPAPDPGEESRPPEMPTGNRGSGSAAPLGPSAGRPLGTRTIGYQTATNPSAPRTSASWLFAPR